MAVRVSLTWGLKCVSCRWASAARTPSSACGCRPSVAYAHSRLLRVCGFTCAEHMLSDFDFNPPT